MDGGRAVTRVYNGHGVRRAQANKPASYLGLGHMGGSYRAGRLFQSINYRDAVSLGISGYETSEPGLVGIQLHKESMRQIKDAATAARKPVKPEQKGFYRGAKIKAVNIRTDGTKQVVPPGQPGNDRML